MTSTTNTKKNPSVVYSFEGRWEELLRRGHVKVFFRKRRPVKPPERVFFYIGVPVKSIIGFASVDEIKEVSLREALLMKDAGAITENELIKYIGSKDSVYAIYIKNLSLLNAPKSLSYLNENFGFNPPQSFSILDESFESVLAGGEK